MDIDLKPNKEKAEDPAKDSPPLIQNQSVKKDVVTKEPEKVKIKEPERVIAKAPEKKEKPVEAPRVKEIKSQPVIESKPDIALPAHRDKDQKTGKSLKDLIDSKFDHYSQAEIDQVNDVLFDSVYFFIKKLIF